MKKIIHVDNSDFFRKLMRTFLENQGFEVEDFASAVDADIAIQGGSAALVITGLELAGAEGDSFIKKVVEFLAGPVIVISSSIDKKKEAALRALGVKAAINKTGAWQEALKPYLADIK
jgi:two-component system cell cycle response regulator